MKEGQNRTKAGLLEEVASLREEISALKKSTKKDRESIFMSGPVVMFKWQNSDGWPVVDVSQNVKDVFGYSVDDFISGRVPYAEVIHVDDFERVVDEVMKASESGAISFHHDNYRVIHKNGKAIWVDDYTSIIRNKNNEITHYYGYVIDITERKWVADMMEKRLTVLTKPEIEIGELSLTDVIDLEFLQNLQNAFALLNNISTFLYDKNGVLITEPSELSEFCQLVHSTPKGRSHCENFRIGRIGVLIKEPKALIGKGCALKEIATGTVPIMIQGQLIANWGVSRLTGDELNIDEISLYADEIGVDKDDLLNAARALKPYNKKKFEKALELLDVLSKQISQLGLQNLQQARDISKRREAEKALVESEEKLAGFMESATDGFVLWDNSLNLIDINNAGMKIINVNEKKETVIGKNIKEFFPKIKISGMYDKYMRTLETGNPFVINNFPIGYKYSNRHLYLRVFKMGKGLGMIGSDITNQLKIQEELNKMEKLESIGLLAGGIAHDFNNILAVMLGYVELGKFKQDPGSDTYSDLLEIEKAVGQARDLANQLLTFSSGGAPIKKDADIVELIKDTVKFILRGSAIKPAFKIETDVLPVEIDKGQISQVINNLVLNAKEAMQDNGILEISIENILSEMSKIEPDMKGDYIKISIKDHGDGINRDVIEKIFDPFFTTKNEGKGLGLSSSHSIIRQHGGRLTVESILGKGTEFHIFLPALKNRDVDKDKAFSKIHKGTGKILIMDDDKNVRGIILSIIEHLGYSVEGAENGYEAIKMYKRAKKAGDPFTAAILDLTVPGSMGGLETVTNLLEYDSDVKAIAASGYTNSPIMANYTKHGFTGVVSKPFTINEVSQLLRSVINSEDANQKNSN